MIICDNPQFNLQCYLITGNFHVITSTSPGSSQAFCASVPSPPGRWSSVGWSKGSLISMWMRRRRASFAGVSWQPRIDGLTHKNWQIWWVKTRNVDPYTIQTYPVTLYIYIASPFKSLWLIFLRNHATWWHFHKIHPLFFGWFKGGQVLFPIARLISYFGGCARQGLAYDLPLAAWLWRI